MLIPHVKPGTWANGVPPASSGRFAAAIRSGDPTNCQIALVGLPDDLGIRLNNGRPGAREGPTAFRAALSRYGAAYDVETRLALEVNVFDAGDVEPAPGDDAAALSRTHARVTEALEAVHALGMVPVCVGGGHDLTFAAVRALAHSLGDASSLGGINVDAHLDVRETIGSGMAFRALIEGGILDARKFTVLGAGLFANSQEHCQWLLDRGARIIGIENVMDFGVSETELFSRTMRRAATGSARHIGAGFVSIDLDAIDAAHAPGVSAMNPMGLSVRQVEQLARRAGEHAAVRHFDIMELSPAHDLPVGAPGAVTAGMTARIAAMLFLSFVRGFAEREQ